MPLIEVHLIEKVFNPEQKRQIIGEWGMGGKPVTTEAVKELAAGRNAA